MSRVVIIGAGPAGAVAAALLAREGREVTVIDAGRPAQIIGETLPYAGARLLRAHDLPGPLDQPVQAGGGLAHVPITGVISRWGGTVLAEDALSRPGGADWRLDRARFDRDLLRAACHEGARHARAKVRHIYRAAAGWQVETDEGVVHPCDWLIDASGRRAVAAKVLGRKLHRDAAQVAVWAIGRAGLEGRNSSKTLIDAETDGWWYGAVLPDGRPIAAFHTAPRKGLDLARDLAGWQRGLARSVVLGPRLPTAAFDGASLHIADASGYGRGPVCGPGWIAIGDAAMGFDPLASRGLFHAIRTGIAPMAILRSPAAALLAYEAELTEVRRRYVLDRARFQLTDPRAMAEKGGQLPAW